MPRDGIVDALSKAHARLRDAYWKRKDVNLVVQVALEARATAAGDDSPAVLGALKAIEYDLGSFTWPGWAEPGITLTRDHLAIGLEAARRNLELADRLDRAPIARSRAHFLLGAHLWAAGEREAAAARFDAASELADSAGNRAEALLAALYAATVKGADTEPLAAALAAEEDGDELVRQVVTARDALERQQPAKSIQKAPAAARNPRN